MGGGSWSARSFARYSASTKSNLGSFDSTTGKISYKKNVKAQDIYRSKRLDPTLNPCGVTRECVDSEEHPNTVPVILALDVSGSMGQAAVEVSSVLNTVMTELYKKYSDIEFMIMGIGDFAYDNAPLQVSQFESDIRIAEQLDKVYFEFGGGGNRYESYTAAWYFGLKHTKLDCWKRGKKGIIITMGDEEINPYLPFPAIELVTGDMIQDNVETPELFEEAKEKFDIYHINVEHGSCGIWNTPEGNVESFAKVIGSQHVTSSNIDSIADTIVRLIDTSLKEQQVSTNTVDWTEPAKEESSEGSTEQLFNQDIDW